MKRTIIFLVFCVAVATALPDIGASGCVINPFTVDPHPLIVLSGSTDFVYPAWKEKVLRFSAGQSVDLICPGHNILIDSSSTKSSLLTATCVGTTIFTINGQKADWSQLSCDKAAEKTIRYTGNSCENSGREIEIGFDVDDGRFLRHVLICFNQQLEIAYYAFSVVPASINQGISSTPRPAWSQGSGIYSIKSVNSFYTRNKQRKVVNQLLDLSADSKQYIQDGAKFYLARGHMSARADGFYAAQQNATFLLENVAPQWQSINGYNWKEAEESVRDYAEANGVDLYVWTGVHGIATLPNADTGEDTELYIYVNSTSKLIPIPEFYWKVAYDPETEKGVALITSNNPYVSSFAPGCEDISDSLTWVSWKKTDVERGLSFACTVDSLREIVGVLPNFSVSDVLL